MKGVFTRMRTPKLAAYVLREYWAKTTDHDDVLPSRRGLRK